MGIFRSLFLFLTMLSATLSADDLNFSFLEKDYTPQQFFDDKDENDLTALETEPNLNQEPDYEPLSLEGEAQDALIGFVEGEISSQLKTGDVVFEELAEIRPSLENLAEVLADGTTQIDSLDPYDSLHITHEDKRKIADILMTMAENNVFSLLFEKSRLKRVGDEIHHVHPLRFLGAIFTDPRLVYCIRQIYGNMFKWNGFIDGLSGRFQEEINEDNVNLYVPGFAAHVQADPIKVQRYIDHNDYENMVKYLMDQKRR